MTKLLWTNEMSVGVHSLDSDHKLLSSLYTQLEEAVAAGEGLATVGSMLNALVEYTAYHFAREEALMKACAHRGRVKHAKDHGAIMERMIALRDEYLARHHRGLSPEKLDLIAGFILTHFDDFDRAYIKTMKDKRDAVRVADATFAQTSLGDSGAIDDSPDIALV